MSYSQAVVKLDLKTQTVLSVPLQGSGRTAITIVLVKKKLHLFLMMKGVKVVAQISNENFLAMPE